MQLQVVIQSDDGMQRTEIHPANGPLTIGRHPQCSIRLDSDLVSRQHAVLSLARGGPGTPDLRVEDVSTNGTIAGDLLLRRDTVDVAFGTPIVLGDFTLLVYAAEPTAPLTGQGMGLAERRFAPTLPADRPRGSPIAFSPPPSGSFASFPAAPPLAPAPHAAVPPPAPGLTQPAPAMPATDVELRREIHRRLLEQLDLATIDARRLDDPSLRPKVLNALRRILDVLVDRLPKTLHRDTLIGELVDEALGLGPLERLLADPRITEIMVVDPQTIYVEEDGKIVLSNARFTDDDRVRAVVERIVQPLGRRIDESSPLVDARLKDGSRVNAVIRPLALRGTCLTIRKFSRVPLTLDRLYQTGSLTERMGTFLLRSVRAKRNIVISGGTGSGKTTLLNVLSAAIPADERIVTIEDAAELRLEQPHVVALETRPPNLEGRGEYTIRDLVKNALRMRPDRIVVGECRGGEALDMLQAMNTGHDGSLTTTHANSPEEALSRLETLVLMSGVDLPLRAVREQVAASVHLIVQQSRMSDGTRKVTSISEVAGIDRASSEIELRPIFEFCQTGTTVAGKVAGEFRATGYVPSFISRFIVMGMIEKGEHYL